MKSLGTWLPPCDISDLSVKLDAQGQNQLTGALWDTSGGFRIQNPMGRSHLVLFMLILGVMLVLQESKR